MVRSPDNLRAGRAGAAIDRSHPVQHDHSGSSRLWRTVGTHIICSLESTFHGATVGGAPALQLLDTLKPARLNAQSTCLQPHSRMDCNPSSTTSLMRTQIMRTQNISLLGLLAMVACAAIGISHAITSFRLSSATAELTALRQRLELLPVESPDLVVLRQLPSTDDNTRRWAVRIPENATKILYANWGSSSLSEIQDVNHDSTKTFQLTPDPITREAMVRFTVQRNPKDPKWGALTIESGDVSVIAIDAKITSLLMGETPSRSEAVGDKAVTRLASSPITIFATDSSSNPKAAFCLWLDAPQPDDGDD